MRACDHTCPRRPSSDHSFASVMSPATARARILVKRGQEERPGHPYTQPSLKQCRVMTNYGTAHPPVTSTQDGRTTSRTTREANSRSAASRDGRYCDMCRSETCAMALPLTRPAERHCHACSTTCRPTVSAGEVGGDGSGGTACSAPAAPPGAARASTHATSGHRTPAAKNTGV